MTKAHTTFDIQILADKHREPTESFQEQKEIQKNKQNRKSVLHLFFPHSRAPYENIQPASGASLNWQDFVVTFGRAAERGFLQNVRGRATVFSKKIFLAALSSALSSTN